MAKQSEEDTYFKIDPEPHLLGNMEPINHFPGVQMWWRAIDGCKRALVTGIVPKDLEDWEIQKNEDPS